MTLPSSKYWKFRKIDSNTYKMLANQEFWFSHPRMFNDPFDTNVNIGFLVDKIKDALRDHGRLVDAVEKIRPQFQDRHESRFLFCVNSEKPELKPYQEVLMWSHYADEHKGICLGLSMNSLQAKLQGQGIYGAWPAYYGTLALETLLQHVDHWDDRDFEERVTRILDKFSFIKSPNWSYEREFRFVKLDENSRGKPGVSVPFEAGDIEHVVFGLRTPESDQKSIANIIRNKGWKHVAFFKAERGKGIFELELHPVEFT